MIDRLSQIIAPNVCLNCHKRDGVVCQNCFDEVFTPRVQVCLFCNAMSPDGATCQVCRRKYKLAGATIGFRLEGVIQEAVYKLKYGHDRSAGEILAQGLAPLLESADYDVMVYVPSGGEHLRVRGYDPARVIARELARQLRLPLVPVLQRLEHTPQVGARRAQRFKQVRDNFVCRFDLSDLRILLVDDVATTGATLAECASVLREAGAKRIWAAVVAKK